MYELVQVGPSTYYIQCPAKMGVYTCADGGAYLIDSGNDKEAGRKVLKIFQQRGWNLKAIINTHSNADHIGGNRYLQRQTGCRVFAGGIEAAFIQHPILEPSFLYGGYPGKDLRHKFLLAETSEVTPLDDAAFPAELQVISLPGHFFAMIGVRTPDDVVFLADCVSSRAALEKYQVAFIYDVQQYLETLDRVERMQAGVFVPAHADAARDIKELARLNRDKVLEIASRLVAICREPLCFESILQNVFETYRLTMNFEQYVLVGSTVRSYLSWLKDADRLRFKFEESKMLWYA